MPAVLRMRQGGYFFSAIGMPAADLMWAVERVPGLEILPDTSHCGLYLNGRRMAAGELEPASGDRAIPWLEPWLEFVRQLPSEPADTLGYFSSFGKHAVNAQISNAKGILGEGLPYAMGDYDLDPTIRWLGQNAQHIITETLEPNQDDAVYMKDALVRMRKALT
jgi:hypothetical protein